MTSVAIWLWVATIAVLLLLYMRRTGSSGKSLSAPGSNERAPFAGGDLALLLSEQNIRDDKLGLAARVDQVYEMADGEVLIVDNKLRDRAEYFVEDQVELSVARTILVHRMRKRVKPYGYLRLIGSKPRREFVKVPLLSPAQVIELRTRYRQVSEGDTLPEAKPGWVCGTCSFDCQYRKY